MVPKRAMRTVAATIRASTVPTLPPKTMSPMFLIMVPIGAESAAAAE